ncbi:Transcriptional regulator, AraC family [[Actinomadura] parvosata subsp. kistnae]|uniref:AraC family transcriptional regulator n=1 Tax=[Actinomadura] parvosata TaxID=1955412 RepID=UPI000D267B3A|nr:helix-turn-helix domain-containing protein [Nonomuraea sp. ATCC 55076]SPL89423.1 Transcriptional regulator, AraC family [Actinomadura parvosata subsp. kistnae]
MSAQPDAGAPALSRFVTDDLGEVREWLDRVYGSRLLMGRIREGTARLAVSAADAGPLRTTDLTLPGTMTCRNRDIETVRAGLVLSGTVTIEDAQGVHRYGPGDALMATFPGDDLVSRAENLRIRTVTLPVDLLADVAGTPHNGSAWPPRLLSRSPHGPAASRMIADALALTDALLSGPAATHPLVVGNAARLLAAGILAAFPTTLTVREEARADHVDATPAVLRLAVAHIEAHYADPDLSLADIAAAACATPRAVQYAFRRHHGTTPMGYVRRVRLAAAHADLLAADPAAGATVSAIAARWGFYHLGRFSAFYRRVYGRSPRDTLST